MVLAVVVETLAASTGWEEESLFHGESASESIVDNESETQSLSN